MVYTLTILFIGLHFIRPFEWSPTFRQFPVLVSVAGVAFLSLLASWATNGYRPATKRIDLMMVGFMASIGLSHISNNWFGGGVAAMEAFLPTFLAYFLVVHSLNGEKKIEGFITVLALCAVAVAIAGIVQYHTGASVAGAEALVERDYDGAGKVVGEIRRIRWLGPYSDPNDLAIILVSVLPLLMHRVTRGRYLGPLLCIPPILYACYLTNSRGAVLSISASIVTYFVALKGNWRGLLVASILMILVFLFGPSRTMSMFTQESSSYGRLEAWDEGFQILKQFPVFGSGAGTFTDYSTLTAHNSFVLVFAELGLVGAFFFLGVFYGPLEMALVTLSSMIGKTKSDNLSRSLVAAAISSFSGVAVSMFFLSRSYTLLPYLVLGVMAAVARMTSDNLPAIRKESMFFEYSKKIIGIELALLLIINLALKIML